MNEIVLMTVQHSLDNLFEKGATCGFIKSSSLNNVVQQLSSLQELHDNGNFHIFQCETIVDFDYILMSQRFKNFCFYKNSVNITDRTYVLRFDCLDGKLFSC